MDCCSKIDVVHYRAYGQVVTLLDLRWHQIASNFNEILVQKTDLERTLFFDDIFFAKVFQNEVHKGPKMLGRN